jgi:CBS domain-containing protein
MKVRDVMTSEVVTARADTTLEEIATMMKAGDTGAIPVVEENELLGLITDRDIVIRCVAEGHDPSDVTAEDILSENLEVVDPDTNVEEALDLMARHQIRRLPVVDNGELVGMVSLGDMAVKRSGKKDTGETLKDVSKGVKQARHAPQPAAAHATKPVAPATKRGEEPARAKARVVSIRPDADAPAGGHKKSGKREAS